MDSRDGGSGSSPMMAAYLDHAVLSSPEVESRVALGLAGRISVTHKVTWETLDPGPLGRMMPARNIVFPLVGVVFGGWFWLEGS
jgi:hypothetical protein